jgi:hypothetical protein
VISPTLPVPHDIPDLTPQLMTAALAIRCPGAVVDKIDIGEIEDGTNRRAPVQLSYAEGSGPRAVFVKVQGRPLHRLALLALRAWATEALFAASGAARPLEHPAPFAAAIDRRRLATIVVMDDVTTHGGIANDGVASLSAAQVRDGLAGLARLHAAYWDRPLPASLHFLKPWRLTRKWAPVSGANLMHGLRKLRMTDAADAIPRYVTALSLERQFRQSALRAASGPQTVLHGDAHPANTYALPEERIGFLDWQLARTGHWSHDVGYFIAGSLEIDQRREHERDLLALYLDALHDRGIDAPTGEEAWRRYRATPAYGLATWLHTLSAGSFQPLDTCLATIRRYAAAYDDLQTAREFS